MGANSLGSARPLQASLQLLCAQSWIGPPFIRYVAFATLRSYVILRSLGTELGGGNVVGSILGGKYSDIMLRRLKKKNGGVGEPEMRLKSTVPGKLFRSPTAS